MNTAFEIVRLVTIVTLLCVSGALVTPKNRIPLALRGVAKLFRITADEQSVPGWKKLVAFLLVLGAIILALI